jgi:hypothetical protein
MVEFQANATDGEGEPLTWVFDFGDGSAIEVYHTASGAANVTVWNNVTHVFLSTGTYDVTMYVCDVPVVDPGFPHNQSEVVTIAIVENQPPGIADSITASDENPLINWTTGNASVILTMWANDLDGDPLLVTWNFSDGSPDATNSTAGGSTGIFYFTQVHGFTSLGRYNVTANVSDGNGHWVTTYRIINVTSDNNPPELVAAADIIYPPGRGDYAIPNETVSITYIFSDREFDSLTFLVDWGDGSPVLNVTLAEYVNGNLTLVVSHNYSSIGTYIVNLNVTDNRIGKGQHAFNLSFNVKIALEPIATVDYWSWWDFASLSLFLMIPVVIVVWLVFARRRQRELDDAGVTYDQWLVRKKEIQEELKVKRSK